MSSPQWCPNDHHRLWDKREDKERENDITMVVRHCDIRLFADDTCLFITVDNREKAAAQINSDLNRISQWATDWLIDFNPTKTKEMIISYKSDTHEHPHITFDNHVVSQVVNHCHLGITLSQNLKWSAHIDNVVAKAFKRIDMMRGLMFKLDRHSLETIYLSFIRPCLEYGDVLLTNASDVDLAKLDSVQKEALRIVVGATARCNTELLNDEMDWPSLADRRMQHSLLLMFKIVNGLAPPFLKDLLPDTVGENQNYNLRNNDELRVPFARLNVFRDSPILAMITRWNQLNVSVKNKPTYYSFKKAITIKTGPRKEILYYGKRWAAIHHARIRIGCSKLNEHLCNNLHVIPSPRCVCDNGVEDSKHFFLTCSLFDGIRPKLIETISTVTDTVIDMNMLLYGDRTKTQELKKSSLTSSTPT